jgi:pimeloyl-ACP methyl ester carboxylesterase
MRRGWKIAIAILVALAVLLVVNALITDQETKGAGVTIPGGEIVHVNAGDVQVVEEGPADAQPIVLIHGYGASLHWWDRLAPLLAKDHRVIRVDLLGFGGSEKPSGGYSMTDEAQAVAEVLAKLGVQGAVIVGHSMGFDVATALAAQSSELVDRLVDIDEAPGTGYGSLPFLARLGYVPVLGQALWRVTPDFAVRDSYGDAFAPGFDVSSGFPNPNQVVDDYHAMTYSSYHDAAQAEDDYVNEEPLDARVRAADVPLLVMFGAEDQLQDDPQASAQAYSDVPGVEIKMIPGAGHTPQIEKPDVVAALIDHFAAQAHYVAPTAHRHQPKRHHTPKRHHHARGHGGRKRGRHHQHAHGRNRRKGE